MWRQAEMLQMLQALLPTELFLLASRIIQSLEIGMRYTGFFGKLLDDRDIFCDNSSYNLLFDKCHSFVK